MNLALIRAGLRQRRRSVWGIWQRSLLLLFLVPPVAAGALYVLQNLSDLLFQFMVTSAASTRLETWLGLLQYLWLSQFGILLAMRLMGSGAPELPWAIDVLPGSRRAKRLAWGLAPILAWAAFAVVSTSLAARQLKGGLGLYGLEWYLAVGALYAYFASSIVWAFLGADLVLGAWRRGASVRGLALLAVAAAAAARLGFGPHTTGVSAFFGPLYRARADYQPGLALLLAETALACAGLLWLAGRAPSERRRTTRAAHSRRGRSDWVLPERRWRAVSSADLKLIRRERGGLFAAVLGQLIVLTIVWLCLASPFFPSHDPAVRRAMLANVVLLLPFIWGSQAALAGGLEALGGQQLCTAPTSSFERLWGKLAAAFLFSGINWIGCVLAFSVVFESHDGLSVAGIGIGYLVVAVASGFLAGYLAPPDLASFRAVQGSNQTWFLVAILASAAWGLAFGAGEIFEGSLASSSAQLLATALAAGVFFLLVQRLQLRHGLRPR